MRLPRILFHVVFFFLSLSLSPLRSMIHNNKLPNNNSIATYTASDPDKLIPLKISIKISGLSCRCGFQYRCGSMKQRIVGKQDIFAYCQYTDFVIIYTIRRPNETSRTVNPLQLYTWFRTDGVMIRVLVQSWLSFALQKTFLLSLLKNRSMKLNNLWKVLSLQRLILIKSGL